MKIVSIDPGTRNLGYAVWDNGKLTDFGSLDLFKYVKKKKQTDYPFMVNVMVAAEARIFNNVDVLLIENQMQARMKMVACALRCFFWKAAVPISPKSVRSYLKISCCNYRANKKASIHYLSNILSKSDMKKVSTHKKKDDVADAVVQLYYYIKKNSLY